MKHWQLNREDSGIVVAVLDKAGESANSLSAEVMAELAQILDQLDLYPPQGADRPLGQGRRLHRRRRHRRIHATRYAGTGPGAGRRGWELFNRLAAVKLPDAGAGARPLPGRRPRAGAGLPLPAGGR
jgi:3-hydroxyacyl-CoA dehydrogenase / enoyl-CoA hydratase / 3-hydroxybutyryl-CoA epimerase